MYGWGQESLKAEAASLETDDYLQLDIYIYKFKKIYRENQNSEVKWKVIFNSHAPGPSAFLFAG